MNPVLLGTLIAIPVAYYFMHQWLQGLHTASVFTGGCFSAAAIAVIIALITVSFQAVKAAVANPVKSLRNE
ncbi:MAG: hypothetical protein WKI04_15400 [Ferruginibacter sp.]